MTSPNWDNGTAVDAGAVTWGNGTTGVGGVVSAANSLAGTTSDDLVGVDSKAVRALANGNCVVSSHICDNGSIVDAGAVTFGFGTGGTTGPITAENSVLGTAETGGESLNWDFDGTNRQLVVGGRADNIVTLVRPDLPAFAVYLPVVMKNAP